jgi:hypothetical protein
MEVSFKIQLLQKIRIDDAFNPEPNYVDLVKLIRGIQRAEGNIDCYHRGETHCSQMDCVWRDHCLMLPGGKSPHPNGLQEKKVVLEAKQKEGG